MSPLIALPVTSMMEEGLYTHQPDTEPIPGYRLISPLGRGGFGEVWKCEAPGGLHKAIKFVHGGLHSLESNAPAEGELKAIQRVKSIRHPFILSMERVEHVDGELVIVLELADRSLGDVLSEEQKGGNKGIARDTLLAYLREAAEALDVLHVRHGLQHLDIKPQNLFLVSNHVKVGDFGLVCSLATGRSGKLGAITPVYAAPEVFQGNVSKHSDQYSLAIVYQELLTGTLPYPGKNARQLMIQHLQQAPDLASLPEQDRAIVARALDKDPESRFASCSDFIQALIAGQSEVIVSTKIISETGGREEDTRRTPLLKTVKTRVPNMRPPIPPGLEQTDLELLDMVARTPLTEVWTARRGDVPRLVKVIYGCPAPGDAGVAKLGALQHPALVGFEILHHAPGRLLLSSAPTERTMRDALQEYQNQGQPGISRRRLLTWLRAAAEALTQLAEMGLYHLGLNPRTLALDGERVELVDFGLVQLVWLPGGQQPTQLNARYSAPELLHKQLGPGCDQYSLALIYHELLTGYYPLTSSPARKGGAALHVLDRLPAHDRAIVARALDPEPEKRFPTVVDFIDALEAASPDASPLHQTPRPTPIRQIIPAPTKQVAPTGEVLQSRMGTSLSPEQIRERLEGFRQQWQARLVSNDAHVSVYQMQTPRSFWQRWTGKQPGLEIHIHLNTPNTPELAPEMAASVGRGSVQMQTEMRIDLRPRDCSREQSAELLRAVGPLVIESLRGHMQVSPRGRTQERIAWHHALKVTAILADGSMAPAVECQGKDISLNGIGFYVPGNLPSSQVILNLPPTPQTPQLTVPARIVRVQGCGDGWFEVGAVLLPPEELPPEEGE